MSRLAEVENQYFRDTQEFGNNFVNPSDPGPELCRFVDIVSAAPHIRRSISDAKVQDV